MLKTIIESLGLDNIKINEQTGICKITFDVKTEDFPEYGFFNEIMHAINDRDYINITLDDGCDNFFHIKEDTNSSDFDEYVKDLLDDNLITININIYKHFCSNRISVYFYESFIKQISKLSIKNIMLTFVKLFEETNNNIVFELQDENRVTFATKTIFFTSKGEDNCPIIPHFDRTKRISDCKISSNFSNLDTLRLIPDDFEIFIDYSSNPLTEPFKKISTLLSIAFISNISDFKDYELICSVNGQFSAINENININRIFGNHNLYLIYDWIYTDGNIIDKMLLARNAISLFCNDKSILNINETVINSIKSNYSIYLKDNLQNYINVRKSLAKYITETISKTGEYSMFLFEKLKNNLILIASFLFTVVIANIVSSQPLDNIFTRDIVYILYAILVGSFFYMIISVFQFNFEFKKVIESYNLLKDNYRGLFNEDDLEDIFNNDKLLDDAKSKIEFFRAIFITIWMISIIFLFFLFLLFKESLN